MKHGFNRLLHSVARAFHQRRTADAGRDLVESNGNIRAVHLGVHEDFYYVLDHFSECLMACLLTRRLYRRRNSIEMFFHHGVKQRTFVGPAKRQPAILVGSRSFLLSTAQLAARKLGNIWDGARLSRG
jgi:hypothetical protein